MIRQFSMNFDYALRLGRAFAPACIVAVLLALPVSPAVAQAGLPPMPGGASQSNDAVDPPARVVRLIYINGTVSFHTLDATEWEVAVSICLLSSDGSSISPTTCLSTYHIVI